MIKDIKNLENHFIFNRKLFNQLSALELRFLNLQVQK